MQTGRSGKRRAGIEQLLLVLENMEKQYEAVTRELQEVKGELSKVKNGSVKGKALSLIRQAESYVEEGKEQTAAIKGRILASIERAVEHAKDTGTLLIAQAIDLTRSPLHSNVCRSDWNGQWKGRGRSENNYSS